MRIAYLVNQYPKTSHSFVRREIRALEKLNVSVSRFSLRVISDFDLYDEEDVQENQITCAIQGVKIHTIFISIVQALFKDTPVFFKTLALAFRIGVKSDRSTLYHGLYFIEACILRYFLRGAKIDHLHSHFGTNSTTVAMLCHCLGGPAYSFTVHGPEEFDCPIQIALSEKIYRSKFVVAISNFCRGQILRWSDSNDWEKIHIVPCTVDEKFISSEVKNISDNNRIAVIGRLSGQKGHFLALEAFSLLKKNGIHFDVVFAGDGELRSKIEEKIRDLGLEDCVSITGWLSADGIKEEILKSRFVVMPSLAEGLPVVAMEAYSLGRPVLATRIAGMPELIEHRLNGWLIDSGCSESLFLQLVECLKYSSQDLEKMASIGKERILDKHIDHKSANVLRDLFEECIDRFD